MDNTDMEYGGFWLRTVAAIIDTILVLAIVMPLLSAIYGQAYWQGTALFSGFWDVMLNYILPAIVVILFWVYKSATPGKMILKLRIVDAKTGGKPSTAQLIGRYLAYYVAIFPLMLGILWVAVDKRKQGWHDKLAGTLVVKNTAKTLPPAEEQLASTE